MLARRTRIRLVRLAKLPAVFVLAGVRGWRDRRLFDSVETYCAFVGYPRSGHTLIAALLNAHPEIVLANELGALDWLNKGLGRRQICSLILARDRAFARAGYEFQGYRYEVKGQWQGRFRRLRVVGDKDGARDNTLLQRRPDLLARMGRVMRARVRVVHVVRNPYDTLATFVKREKTMGVTVTVDEALGRAARALEMSDRILRGMGGEAALTVRHEDFVADPRQGVRNLCSFLGVEAPEDYVEACAAIVFGSPRRTREAVPWTPEQVAYVQSEMIARYDFLSGYGP
jgi:sulfotransferase family protein